MRHLNKRQREKIAREITATIHGEGAVTEQIVRDVETGVDFTASHPVHQQILAAIQREKIK
jgi:hypothetical protein